jgi:hypothetical protein
MIFYQQSAVAEKKLLPEDLRAARLNTAAGAVLTPVLDGSRAGCCRRHARHQRRLGKPGQCRRDQQCVLSPLLGVGVGRLVFSAGVPGASMVAAIVSSLALGWGVGKVAGYRRSLEYQPFDAKWFYGVYAVCVLGAGTLVWFVLDLVELNIAAQVLNAFLLPLVIGFLVALAVKTLPGSLRPRGVYLWVLIGISVLVIAVGLFGGVSGLL